MQSDGITEVLRALADPTRRGLFERLARGETTVKELTAGAHVSQAAVSQHLATLKRAGLVAERQSGRNAFYRVSPKGLWPLLRWIEHYQAFWTERLGRLERLLEQLESEE